MNNLITQNAEKFEDNYDVLSCDLSIEKDVSELSKEINYKYDGIDILVNNAGITEDSLFMRMDYLKWNRVINTNLNSNFLLTNSFIRKMIKKKWGRIVNFSSEVAHRGNPGLSHYAASKAGVIAFSKCLALEVIDDGICVNTLAPGPTDTTMLSGLDKTVIKKLIDDLMPIGRLGRPEEIAAAALFLSSEEAAFCVGSTIAANGGSYLY